MICGIRAACRHLAGLVRTLLASSLCRNTLGYFPEESSVKDSVVALQMPYVFADAQANSFISGLFNCAAIAGFPPVLLLRSASGDCTESNGLGFLNPEVTK